MSEDNFDLHEKKTLAGLARKLSRLPADQKRAAIEASASLAGVSLKVSRAFVEAVPPAAKLISGEDLKSWAEMGRRIAMGSAEKGVVFFESGVGRIALVPADARTTLFEICIRQLALSSATAMETFDFVPQLAEAVGNDAYVARLIKLASEVSKRSARHSWDFLVRSADVCDELRKLGAVHGADAEARMFEAIIELGHSFVGRTGGMTADLWANLPAAIRKLDPDQLIRLCAASTDFLEFGGSVTLSFVDAGSVMLQKSPDAFDHWITVLRAIAVQGNAVLIAFLRATPPFFEKVSGRGSKKHISAEMVRKVLTLVGEIAVKDAESALAAFRSSTKALQTVTLEQFEEWVETGLSEQENATAKARKSFFALETKQSNEILREAQEGLALDKVQTVLRIYVEGLTGKEVEIAPLTAMPQESRIGDGKTIYLPTTIQEFDSEETDFRLYKVLAAHGAGQIEFGTFDKDTKELKAAYAELSELYAASIDETDAFSLAGYIEDVQKGEKALSDAEIRAELKKRVKHLPKKSDYREVLQVFPEPRLAKKIFGTMENARVDGLLRRNYRGLRKDLDLMQQLLRERRPYIFDLPMNQVPFELLFQITLCGGATDDARQFYGQVVSEIETVVENYLLGFQNDHSPTVADSVMATSRVYTLFKNIQPEEQKADQQPDNEDRGDFAYEDKNSAESVLENQVRREKSEQKSQDVKDLFNAWNMLDDEDDETDPDGMQGAEAWTQTDTPEQELEPQDQAFFYDEWDRELNDYRVSWSRVIEKKVKLGDRNFVELARSRYRGVISSIRHQFQLMKPENLTRINREIDGEDYDLNALIDYVIDKRADGRQAENIYTKRLRRQRDVAVSLLLDQSSSTARTITRNPMQPYTHPGRRIIEIEKEGLVLMSEALEAVGDAYSISGFTSEGRRNVKFYVVKDFGEKYSEEIERRIGGITFQNNTRMGAAIRHAAAKLHRQESRTKLMIILTDGRPYDHDYGDARYAREDVREALTEAKMLGITPFCITIDRESEAELKDLYGNVGYTIIDDVLSLPERMPSIYRRLTS